MAFDCIQLNVHFVNLVLGNFAAGHQISGKAKTLKVADREHINKGFIQVRCA